jgi:hypothetical protein
MCGSPVEVVDHHKHLGVILNNRATWSDHLDAIITKISKRIGLLRSLKYKLNRSSLKTIYVTQWSHSLNPRVLLSPLG